MKSLLEKQFEALLKLKGFIGYVKEYRFCPSRKWRFDFAFPTEKVAVEIEGGVWVNGAHNRGAHFLSDMEKYNWATINGWKVLRYTNSNLKQGIFDLTAVFSKGVDNIGEKGKTRLKTKING